MSGQAAEAGMTKRILVVEDSRTQAEMIRHLLTDAGFEVVVAADGREGLDRCEEWPPDLIVSDVQMPVMDGFEFCRAIRSSASTRHLPLVLLTALESAEDIIKGLESGANNFVPKPYDPISLLGHLKGLLGEVEGGQREYTEADILLTLEGHQITVTADRAAIADSVRAAVERLQPPSEAPVETWLEDDIQEAFAMLADLAYKGENIWELHPQPHPHDRRRI
jgi:two-component system sensor histidine kinase/response regulator